MANDKARRAYEQAVEDLKQLCEDETNLEVFILEDTYPVRVRFTPDQQITFFTIRTKGSTRTARPPR